MLKRGLGLMVVLGACASRSPEAEWSSVYWVETRGLATLHEDSEAASPEPFEGYATAQAAVTAELMSELSLFPELIDLAAGEGDGQGAAENLREALDAYLQWVRRNGVDPLRAARALERSSHGPTIAPPRGTLPDDRDEVVTILHAVGSAFAEVVARLERLEAARARVQQLEVRSDEIVRRIHALAAEESGRGHEPPGLHRSLSADVYHAKVIEADILARAAVVTRRTNEVFTDLHGAIARFEQTVDCLSRGACD